MSGRLTLRLIFIYILSFLYFSSYRDGTATLLMGNISHVYVLGAGRVILKLTSGKTI